MEQAVQAMQWVQDVTNLELLPDNCEKGFKDQFDFTDRLKDGVALCKLINVLQPNSVNKINSMQSNFKQRENIEMFLKGCQTYGLQSHDLFQVNDLYERKNPYMVVNCLFALGGLAQKKGFDGPTIGVKVANQNKRSFSKETMDKGKSILSLQAGNYKGASQAGMTPYGASRQIMPDGR